MPRTNPFQLILDEQLCHARSRDRYWKSNALKTRSWRNTERGSRSLNHMPFADLILEATDTESMSQAVATATKLNVPMTLRGFGSGWYGAGACTLQGGVVMDTSRCNEIKEVDWQKGIISFTPGVKMRTLREVCLTHGWDMRIYSPISHSLNASFVGFMSCAEYGIGSTQYGSLCNFGNIIDVKMITMEENPQLLTIDAYENSDLLAYIPQSLGTLGVISEVTISLAPAIHWVDAAITHTHYEVLLQLSQSLFYNPAVQIRTMSLQPNSILNQYLNEDKGSILYKDIPDNSHLMILSINESYMSFLQSEIKTCNAKLIYADMGNNLGETTILDYQWLRANDYYQKISEDNPWILELHLHDVLHLSTMKTAFEDLLGTPVCWHEQIIRSSSGMGAVAIPYIYDKHVTLRQLDSIVETLLKRDLIQKAVNPNHTSLDKIYVDPKTNTLSIMSRFKEKTDPKNLLHPLIDPDDV